MSEWEQRVREHTVWGELQSLGPVIDIALSVDDITPESILGLERLKSVLAYSGRRVAAADPLLAVPSSLDAVAAAFASVHNELTAFLTDKDFGHITTANITADSALLSVSTLPGLYSPEELGVLIAATTAHRRAVSKALSEAQKKLLAFETKSNEGLASLERKLEENLSTISLGTEALKESLNAISGSIDAERQKLAATATEQQGQFSTAQDTRSKEFSESIRLANEGFNKLIADYQSQFSAAQDARGKEHNTAESTRQTKYNETIAEYTKKLTEQDLEFTKQRTAFVTASQSELAKLSTTYQETAASVLKDIEDKRERIEKLVGVIGNLGVTSGYLRTANAARKAMWGWQLLTVLALAFLSWMAYATLGLLEEPNGHFNWGGFAGRALLLVSLGVIAAYSGSQADKMYVDERRSRKLALELEAIGPYLAPLPIEEQNKFRVQIGDRSFGRDTELHLHHKSPASVLDLFKSKESKEFLELVIEIAKKVK